MPPKKTTEKKNEQPKEKKNEQPKFPDLSNFKPPQLINNPQMVRKTQIGGFDARTAMKSFLKLIYPWMGGESKKSDKFEYSADDMIAYVDLYNPRTKKINIKQLEHLMNEHPWPHTKYTPNQILNNPDLSIDDYKRIKKADLDYPILLDKDGKIKDGYHRLAKAFLKGHKTIDAHVFDKKLMEKFKLFCKVFKLIKERFKCTV